MTKQSKIDIETAADIIEYVALKDLYLSDINPRKEVDDEGIALLADSIATCGLIQNLNGLRDEKGKIGVVAGGRRLRALMIAVESRPDLATVPVKVTTDPVVAEEWANAENTAREALDPVDEIRAYRAMAKKGSPLASISRAFGVTEPHVRRRMALANLPEAVLDALKARDISMGIAQAMTVSDNEAKILEVLDRAKNSHWFSEHDAKRALKPDALDGNDRMAKFVGLEAYEAAGGTITADLFEEETLLNDPETIERLFEQKLQTQAETIRAEEGWAWVTVSTESYIYWYDLQRKEGLARTYKIEGVLSEEQSERYDELAELANGDVIDEAGEAELEALEAIMEGDYSAEQKALAGIIVCVSHHGKISVERGLVKAEDQAAAIEQGVIEASKHGSTEAKKPEKPAYSQKFIDDMTAIRLAAVQTALLAKPDYLQSLFAFAMSPASGHYSGIFGLGYNATERNCPEFDDQFVLDPRLGGEHDDKSEKDYDAVSKLAKKGKVNAFKAYRALGKKVRNGQVTAFLARAFTMQDDKFMADIEAEIGADIRSVWTPSATNCFKRLKGDQLDAIFKSMLDLGDNTDAYRAFCKSKKGVKADDLHKLFNDPERQKKMNVTAEQKARIDAWVPACF
ncbi:MAG: ParB/RepB/Spo0J family partition protein [Pseudomonadota bacterium]